MNIKRAASIDQGMTLFELMVALAMTSMLIAGLGGIVSQALQAQSITARRNSVSDDAHFAMERMTSAVRGSHLLILPLKDKPATPWREHVREQYIPAQAPESGSVFASAVLAVSLDHTIDRNRDGWADANNDKDFVNLDAQSWRGPDEPERIDEDWGPDMNQDGAPGLKGIDDNGDGYIDNSLALPPSADDDEDGSADEDPQNDIDDDGDGGVDEDTSGDMNGDGQGQTCILFICTPIAGDSFDDDDDTLDNEDHIDTVAYYIVGNQLMERWPALVDKNADGKVDGKDYTESVIADQVRWFKVERLAPNGGQQMVEISLELGSDDVVVRLISQARLIGKD